MTILLPHDDDRTPSRGPDRSQAMRMGREAVAITERGSYVAPSGQTVDVAARVARMLAGTADLPSGAPLPARHDLVPGSNPRDTTIAVVNGTALAAAARFAAEAPDESLVLNFASARKVGGGFLTGARAQEESLARSGTLAASLMTSGMYAYHREHRDTLYTSWMIYSPHVTMFRDDDGHLLETPFDCAFVTAPAPNAGVVLERDPSRGDEVRAAMDERIDRCLAIAHAFGHRRLVLGAWGCGVFRNDPEHVARSFARALAGPFARTFDEVVFAVLDWSPERRFIGPFVRTFGG